MPAVAAMRLKITDALRRDLIMRWITQTLAVLALNIRTIPQRLSSSAVAIIGIAGVVVVFVSVLSIAAGFTAAMQGSGSPDRALVMRSGADSEMTSGLERHGRRRHQAGAGHQARRAGAAGRRRAVGDHRSAEEVDARCAGERPGARHRAGEHPAARTSSRSSKGACSSSARTK